MKKISFFMAAASNCLLALSHEFLRKKRFEELRVVDLLSLERSCRIFELCLNMQDDFSIN